MQMKYVVALCHEASTPEMHHEIPVMFPQALTHKHMANWLPKILYRSDTTLVFDKIVGAGFCRPTENGISCYGRSESLMIASRAEADSEAFARCNGYDFGTQIGEVE